MRILSKALDLAENAFAFIGGLLLLISVLSIAFEVISRSLINQSYAIVGELNGYILLYVPFLAAAWLLRENGHITVDLLDRVLPSSILKIGDVIIILVGLFTSGTLTWYGIIVVVDAYQSGLVSLTVVEIPQAYILAAIPLGFALLALEFLRHGWRTLVGTKPQESEESAFAE